MKPLVCYHGSDLDGLACGAIARFILNDCDLMPISYSQAIPDDMCGNRNLYIMDFSFPPALMQKYAKIFTKVWWIDHHRSVINDLEYRNIPNIIEVLDSKYAACELSWTALRTPDLPIHAPTAIKYLGMWDSWRHNDDPDIIAFQYWARSMELDPRLNVGMDMWRILLKTPELSSLIRDGKAIYKYVQRQNYMVAQHYSFEIELPGSKLPAIVLNHVDASSQSFDGVYDPSKHKLMICFRRLPKEWRISFYSTHKDIDCGQLAKEFGGGGHQGAAGFVCKELPDWLSGEQCHHYGEGEHLKDIDHE